MKEFQEWLSELRNIMVKNTWPENYIEQTGEECWREMYEEGLSPQDAWGEEHAAATMD